MCFSLLLVAIPNQDRLLENISLASLILLEYEEPMDIIYPLGLEVKCYIWTGVLFIFFHSWQ